MGGMEAAFGMLVAGRPGIAEVGTGVVVAERMVVETVGVVEDETVAEGIEAVELVGMAEVVERSLRV